MPYIPNSDEDRKMMLEKIGVDKIDDLFARIPDSLHLKRPLDLPEELPEPELVAHLKSLAAKNRPGEISLVGGGIYNHYVPPVVWALAMRPEFATAYTPYQAEVAQGTLQNIYEFQTHICRLTGMDVANASLYDAATAVAEAALLAAGYTRRNKILISRSVSPFYRDVLKSTLGGREFDIVELPLKENITDFEQCRRIIDENCACVIMAQPNFFGYLEELEPFVKAVHDVGALFVEAIDPISLGILKTPAEYDADVAVGEGQALGIPQNFGGPLLGLFACKKEFVRKIPGRLAARTTDVDGKTGFVLTLQTREQHIRREKATSNICSNEALMATAATVYLSLMGKQGLPRVARLSAERAHYLAARVAELDGFEIWTQQPFFKEFVIKTPVAPREIITAAAAKGIAAGIDLGQYYPVLDHHLMVAVTENISFANCDRFIAVLATVGSKRKKSGAAV